MQEHILQTLDAVLRTDNSISPAQRRKILTVIRGEPTPAPGGNSNRQPPRIYSREQTAELLGRKSTRYVDKLCRAGLLEKFTAQGNRRSIGITAKSFEQFLEGGGN